MSKDIILTLWLVEKLNIRSEKHAAGLTPTCWHCKMIDYLSTGFPGKNTSAEKLIIEPYDAWSLTLPVEKMAIIAPVTTFN